MVLMGEACRYALGGLLRQDASVASAGVLGVVGEWLEQKVPGNAGTHTDVVTGERLMARASPCDHWGPQVSYTAVRPGASKQLR